MSAGSGKSTSAQIVKSAYDFSESAERTANLSAFSSPEPVNTFIFGIDKDSEFTQTVSPSRIQSSSRSQFESEINKAQKVPKSELPSPVSPNLMENKEMPVESNKEDSKTIAISCGPFASVAVGRLSAIQNWLRRDGIVIKEEPSSPPRCRLVACYCMSANIFVKLKSL